MNSFNLSRYALSCVAAAMLAGCGGSQPPMSALSAMPQSSAIARLGAHTGSWMTPNTSGALLYISDAVTNEVRVYSWPTLSHVGTLTGFNSPFGECVDTSGNVWIANLNGEYLVKYSHGGSNPIRTLQLPRGSPHGCSVNPKNGDLAVAVESFKFHNPGAVAVFKTTDSNATFYVDPAIQRMTFVAYDTDGNLFVDGKSSDGVFQMAKFKDKKFTPITISGASIETPGGVFADGLALSVGDLSKGHAAVYQITDTGTVTGTTELESDSCAQYFIADSATKHTLICPNFRGPSVDMYDFPVGGKRVEHIKAGLEFPFGSVVSP